MDDNAVTRAFFRPNLQRNLLTGLVTVVPLIVVWVVFSYVLSALSAAGRPLADALAVWLARHYPALAPWAENGAVRWAAGVIVALVILYALGAIASRMVGQKVIGWFELLIARIPLVVTVYGAVKKLIDVLRQPSGGQRVVLIEFPHPGNRAIGLVMRTFTDAVSGAELAAVYVPTSPNPTTGYLQLVPLAALTPTGMTTDQAMTMILSGGAVAPPNLTLTNPRA